MKMLCNDLYPQLTIHKALSEQSLSESMTLGLAHKKLDTIPTRLISLYMAV